MPRDHAADTVHKTWVYLMLSNRQTGGMAAQDGPWFSGRYVQLGSAVHPLRHRRSRTTPVMGVYSSEQAAQDRIARSANLPRFAEYPDDFLISRYVIDEDRGNRDG